MAVKTLLFGANLRQCKSKAHFSQRDRCFDHFDRKGYLYGFVVMFLEGTPHSFTSEFCMILHVNGTLFSRPEFCFARRFLGGVNVASARWEGSAGSAPPREVHPETCGKFCIPD